MADPRDFWHILPHYVKKNVVHYLDFDTRCNLSYCSKSDLKLVKSTPIAFRSINWFTNYQQVTCICFRTLNSSTNREILVSLENKQQVVDSMCRILGAPNTCNTFVCSRSSGTQICGISEVIRELTKQNIRPKIKSMNWNETVDDIFYNFLTQIDAKYLKAMFLPSKDETSEQVARIVETEQWKNLKAVVIGWTPNYMWWLESILGKPVFSIQMNEWSVETAHRIIKNFQDKNHPVGSCFSVNFRNVNVPDTYDDPGELINETDYHTYHLKKFPLADEALELRVILSSARNHSDSHKRTNRISGTVNRKDEEFEHVDVPIHIYNWMFG